MFLRNLSRGTLHHSQGFSQSSLSTICNQKLPSTFTSSGVSLPLTDFFFFLIGLHYGTNGRTDLIPPNAELSSATLTTLTMLTTLSNHQLCVSTSRLQKLEHSGKRRERIKLSAPL